MGRHEEQKCRAVLPTAPGWDNGRGCLIRPAQLFSEEENNGKKANQSKEEN
jgi:hypothetical protein